MTPANLNPEARHGWILALSVAAVLAACTETSLNRAPVIDLSRPNSARKDGPARAAAVAPQAPAAAPAAGAAPIETDSPPAEAEVHAVPLAPPAAVESRALETTPLPAPAPATAPGASGAPAAAPAAAGGTWQWPVDGPVLVKFDAVRGKGIDIGAAEGAPVRAAADGNVSYTGSLLDYGNLVVLEHGNGLRTVYGRNKAILVTQGQAVKRGDTIATAGKTGAAAPLLHFEVRLKGVPVDPLGYLAPR